MTLAEIIAEVYLLTKRPDLSAQTDSAVRMATLYAHHLDFWARDLSESVVDFTTPAFSVSWTYKVAFPRFRAVSYFVKAQHPSNEPYGKPLTPIDPIGAYDSYDIQKQNVWYLAGSNIRFNFSEQVRKVIAGIYLHPNITAPNYESWIADEYPWAIIHRAAERVLNSIGHEDLAARQAQMALAFEAELRLSNVQAQGY